MFTFAVCKATAKTPLHGISLHSHSHRALPGHSVTAGTPKQAGMALPLLCHPPRSPWCIHAWNPPCMPTPLLSVKLIQKQTKKEKINAEKNPASNIGLCFQKQPSIFRATAFKSSAWDILTAISMKAERFQLPWKLASEVGAQHLSKPWQYFCKEKMLNLNHLQLGDAIQF